MDLLNFEAEGTSGVPENADIREVCNYLNPLEHARDQLYRPDELPLRCAS